MKLKILTVPNPILRKKSKAVKKFDGKLETLVRNLEDTLAKKRNPSGVGLSAPQVGKLWRIFTTLLPEDNVTDRTNLAGKKKTHGVFIKTYINPKIMAASKKLTLGPNKKKPVLEGCLSIPDIYGPVFRHQWIRLSYSILDTSYSILEKSEKFSDFSARVIQHELDHLDGILFTDRSLQQKLPLYEEEKGEKLKKIELA